MEIIFLLVSLIATTIGAISGIGGGVIIKPALDATNTLPVATISFLSSCTVLSMAVVSLIRQRNTGVKLDIKRSTSLAIGSAVGGSIGKYIFNLVKSNVNENILGGIQATILFLLMVGVFLFVVYREKIKTFDVKSIFVAVIVGLGLGLTSAFLGVGGGPMNVAALFLFFSMSSKVAALNSIYIIMFSQITSILSSVVTSTVPSFSPFTLIIMISGGVLGGLIGSAISPKISNAKVDLYFKIALVVIMAINVYNMVRFF